jgi:hypothetical protein
MTGQKIDRNRLMAVLRRLRGEEIFGLLGDALDMLPPAKLEELLKGYFDISQIFPERQARKSLLEIVRAFEAESLRGDYYESFEADSENSAELSQRTQAWIFEINRLLGHCIAAPERENKKEIREAMEICFGLFRRIDEGLDDVVFFADEGGSYQVGIDWNQLLPAYFTCLSASAQPEEYAARAVEIVDEFQRHDRDRHLDAAKRNGTPEQRKALEQLLK